jgi:hypothetical protein
MVLDLYADLGGEREGVKVFKKLLETFKLKKMVFSSSVHNLHGESSTIMSNPTQINATLW